MLAQGQVRLTSTQAQMTTEQAVHRQLLAAVAAAEDPAQIIAEAKKLNLVPPSYVKQLPAVPLNTPIGQSVTPSTTTPSTTTPSTTTAASGASSSTVAAAQSAAAGR